MLIFGKRFFRSGLAIPLSSDFVGRVNTHPTFHSGTGFQPVAFHRPEAGATNREPPWSPSLRLIALIHRLPLFSAWQKPYFCRIVAGSHARARVPERASPERPAATAEACPPCPPALPRRSRKACTPASPGSFSGSSPCWCSTFPTSSSSPISWTSSWPWCCFSPPSPYIGPHPSAAGLKALASALTCLILLLVILIPLFSLMSIIAAQALDFSSQVTKGMQNGDLWH